MKFKIEHEIKGRIRIHVIQKRMSFEQADMLQYYLDEQEMVLSAKIKERTQDITVCYQGEREELLDILKKFSYEKVELPQDYCKNSGREMSREYWDRLVNQTVLHFGNKIFLPYEIRAGITLVKSAKYIWQGVKTLARGKIEVPVLDATAIGVSILRGDYATAGSVMYLLGVGETIEEWTHKKSVGDLARSMSLNIDKVWLVRENQEIQVSASTVKAKDCIRVHMGNLIPFDGVVTDGEAMVNQASLTGESEPVRKVKGGVVYAGTVVEEGEITLEVKEANGASKYDKIMTMIEESEKLKSSLEGKAEHLADRLVPYTFAGTGLVWLLSRNVTKAQPTVTQVISFNDMEPDELLRVAACLEEHFPHSMAKAVVREAQRKNLVHEELHLKVEYIVAHGISSKIEDKKVIIGSYHFVFEDEKTMIPEEKKELFDELPPQYSQLYMAMDGKLAAVICIEDPLRKEAADVVKLLRKNGITKVVMMTGDSERIAGNIAKKVGVDEYHSEVLPEDKAEFVRKEREAGRKVIMIGDGINDSPALSAADVGVAIRAGAEIAREIADVTIGAEDLGEIVVLKKLSNALMERIRKNYKVIVGFNTALILLGVGGIIQPTTSALLHNTSTLIISTKSMKNLLEEEKKAASPEKV